MPSNLKPHETAARAQAPSAEATEAGSPEDKKSRFTPSNRPATTVSLVGSRACLATAGVALAPTSVWKDVESVTATAPGGAVTREPEVRYVPVNFWPISIVLKIDDGGSPLFSTDKRDSVCPS